MTVDRSSPLVPKLRFSEFEDAGEWRELRLVDVADRDKKWSFIGGPFGSNLKSSDYTTEGIRVIQLQNIGDAEFVDDYKIFTSEEKADELLSNNIYPGEIILSKMGDPVGRTCLIPDTNHRYVMCSDGIRLVVDEKQYSKYFIYLSINSSHFRSLVKNTATGSTRKRIGLDDLKNLPMQVPSAPEQEKIANCLGSLDDLIAAEGRKLEALRQHKQGLIQQLFPQPGENVPKLRFPEFQDAKVWCERPLSKLSEIVRGGSPRPIDAYLADVENGLNWLKIGDVSKDSKYITHTDQRILPEAVKKTRVVNPGDFILSNSMSFGRPYLLKIRACIHDGWIAVTRLCSAIEENFLYYLMTSGYSQAYFEKSAAGTGVRNLNVNVVGNLPVRFPESVEQHCIADCLGSLDDLIAARCRKLEALQQHKNGLMQQLFPVPERQ